MVIVSFEDRTRDTIGLKLLVASLARHVPGVPLRITCPVADDDLRSWLSSQDLVSLDESKELLGKGWDAKPSLLLLHLDRGEDEVIWMDSDIVVTRDFRPLLRDRTSLVVAQEKSLQNPGKEGRERTLGWHLAPGRSLSYGINSCFVRVTPAHRPLLVAWRALLARPEYQAARSLDFPERPAHLLGDQDVLMALLGSRDFGDLALQVLRSGRDIIQHFEPQGYGPVERLANLFLGLPPLVHSQGHKPWSFASVPDIRDPSFGAYFCVENGPYATCARHYAAAIGGLPACLEVRSLPGRIEGVLSLGNPHLRGFAQSLYASSKKAALRRLAPLRKLRRLLTESRATAVT
jgi:hypothetical protein